MSAEHSREPDRDSIAEDGQVDQPVHPRGRLVRVADRLAAAAFASDVRLTLLATGGIFVAWDIALAPVFPASRGTRAFAGLVGVVLLGLAARAVFLVLSHSGVSGRHQSHNP